MYVRKKRILICLLFSIGVLLLLGACAYGIDEYLTPESESLVGYWPLSENLKGVEGSPELVAAKQHLEFVGGPLLGEDRGLDLRNGQYLKIEPTDSLYSPEISVELFFKVQKMEFGCIFGIRDGKQTRFSLHYMSETATIKLWDGSTICNFEAPYRLETGKWYHLALSVHAEGSTLWVDGQKCSFSGNANMDESSTELPFLVGTSDAEEGEKEKAEIAVADLAIYSEILTEEFIQNRLRTWDWDEKRKAHRKNDGVSEAELDARIEKIKQEYGFDIFYKYKHDKFIPAIWHSYMVGTQISLAHAKIGLDEIEKFLKVIPREVTDKHLKRIYMFDTLRIEDKYMGAMAYDEGIYLCAGTSEHIAHSVYHELTHLLQAAYPPDLEIWKKGLPDDFVYLGNEARINSHSADDKMHRTGFVLKYAMASLSEEMAVNSDYIFTRPAKTRELMKKYPSIKQRISLLFDYYKSISENYDFSAYADLL